MSFLIDHGQIERETTRMGEPESVAGDVTADAASAHRSFTPADRTDGVTKNRSKENSAKMSTTAKSLDLGLRSQSLRNWTKQLECFNVDRAVLKAA
jgi:hypothetical protein